MQPVRGFDRLASMGFSESDIANFRRQFHSQSAGNYLDMEFETEEECAFSLSLLSSQDTNKIIQMTTMLEHWRSSGLIRWIMRGRPRYRRRRPPTRPFCKASLLAFSFRSCHSSLCGSLKSRSFGKTEANTSHRGLLSFRKMPFTLLP